MSLQRANRGRQDSKASDNSGGFVRFLAYTGLRFGEATALRVRDIDLDRRRINVVRAFSDVGGLLVEESPKAHQHRSVPIVPLLTPDLLDRVEGKRRDDLLFTTEGGSVMRLSNWRRRFNQARDAARLDPRLTPHGLRHTAASLFIQAGTPPKVLQMILGHASITMTLDLYGHLYPDEMDRWAERLSERAVANLWPDGANDDDDGQAGKLATVR